MSSSMIAHAGPREEALNLLDKWAKAFSESDVDTIHTLYARDCQFIGTFTKVLSVNSDGIRSYFENSLFNNKPRGARLIETNVLVLSDAVVVVSGLDELTGVREGATFITNGRVTFVIAKCDATWKIVQFHRSLIPN